MENPQNEVSTAGGIKLGKSHWAGSQIILKDEGALLLVIFEKWGFSAVNV